MSLMQSAKVELNKVETFFENLWGDAVNEEKIIVQKVVTTAKKVWIDMEHLDAVFDAWVDEHLVSAFNMTAEEATTLKETFARKLLAAQSEEAATSSSPAPSAPVPSSSSNPVDHSGSVQSSNGG